MNYRPGDTKDSMLGSCVSGNTYARLLGVYACAVDDRALLRNATSIDLNGILLDHLLELELCADEDAYHIHIDDLLEFFQ